MKHHASEKDLSKVEIIERYFKKIEEFIESSKRADKFVAIGECGLDYDRLEHADKET